MPITITRLRPMRRASGTAHRPMMPKSTPGMAVISPAREPDAPNASRTSDSTGPREAMPARRFTAATTTATNASPTGMTTFFLDTVDSPYLFSAKPLPTYSQDKVLSIHPVVGPVHRSGADSESCPHVPITSTPGEGHVGNVHDDA